MGCSIDSDLFGTQRRSLTLDLDIAAGFDLCAALADRQFVGSHVDLIVGAAAALSQLRPHAIGAHKITPSDQEPEYQCFGLLHLVVERLVYAALVTVFFLR
ncbi:MAG: hypothetical protein ACRD43_07250 [Pyrinomonadaceae bacterium]